MVLESLNHLAFTIECLLDNSDIILDPLSREILEFLQKEVAWLQEMSTRMDWNGLDLERDFRDRTWMLWRKVEDGRMELHELKQEIQDLVDLVKKMEEDYADALYNPVPPEDEEDGIDVSQSIGFEFKMVGLSDVYNKLKEKLFDGFYETTRLIGMPGIGKTTLAMKVFADPDIVKYFEVRVWVPVGRRCTLKEIRRRIVARLDPNCLNQMVVEREIAHLLKERLENKRFLIVLDDVWDNNIEHTLLQYFERKNGCILWTTRRHRTIFDITMRHMNKEESWDLLCQKVFGEESCPTHLEKAGKKIAENCKGLPLTIVKIADHLSSKIEEKEYWNEVAEKKNHKLFKDVYDQILKVLLPSYNYLPRLLQICFLYMGVFPQNYEITKSELVHMYNFDEFLRRNKSFDSVICLEELSWNSLIMIYERASTDHHLKSIKTCGLHSSLWHLSTTQARKTKFCHVLTSIDDGQNGDIIIGQHRLSFHNNILCTIKVVYQSVEENCASTVHSLFYYGPYHPFEVPVCFGLRLLRTLNILTIRFYEFPMDILKLVELRYLALTCDGQLPTSISQLSNLRILIVGRHFVITKPSRDQYLPMEIWNMQELQHLQAMGRELPHPPRGALLEKLCTLSNVSASSCMEEIIKAVPNLTKLRLRIELGPNDDGIPLRCFHYISSLEKLTSLTCAIVNPKILPSLASIPVLPRSLEKLSLSGLSLPWKEMSKIAELPSLKVLKVRNYAFTGPYWRVKKGGFPELMCLVIEDSDIVEWSFESGCFDQLRYLTLKHCYRYERMIGKLPELMRKFVVEDCNPLGVQQLKESPTYAETKWQCDSSFIS